MPLQIQYLDRLTQTKYLSEENYQTYRAIMRTFYQEYEKMHYQLDKDTLLSLLQEHPLFADFTADKLSLALDQLVEWRNLTQVQDPHHQYTIEDFKKRRFQYIMTQESREIERMTLALENLSTVTRGLSTNSFRRIRQALDTAARLDTIPQRDVLGWWQELESDFMQLCQNHQDYLREFYDPTTVRQMRSVDFITFKQRLIRYLEDFIQDLQASSAQIGAQLEAFTPEEVDHILELVYQSELEVSELTGERTDEWKQELRDRIRGLWDALRGWFVGSDSNARQVMDVTNEVIRMVVQTAAMIVQMQSLGTNNKAELRHLMEMFSRCKNMDEAHKLSAVAFGAQKVRHYSANGDRETDQVDSSTYDETALTYTLKPHTNTYRPRVDRTGFRDLSSEKAEQRKRVLEEAKRQEALVMKYVQNGKLEFRTLKEPVPPEVRTVFLEWISQANLSPERRGYTQFGMSYILRRRKGTCRLQCTDGILTMPDFVLVFQEARA